LVFFKKLTATPPMISSDLMPRSATLGALCVLAFLNIAWADWRVAAVQYAPVGNATEWNASRIVAENAAQYFALITKASTTVL
jgi:hypothetical protein